MCSSTFCAGVHSAPSPGRVIKPSSIRHNAQGFCWREGDCCQPHITLKRVRRSTWYQYSFLWYVWKSYRCDRYLTGVKYGLSPCQHVKTLCSETYKLLADTINLCTPETLVHCHNYRPLAAHSIPLDRNATFFDYVIVDGRKYHASRTTGSRNSSLVHIVIPNKSGGPAINAYGEILEIFCFDQDIHYAGESMFFIRMCWFRHWEGEKEDIWYTL